MENKETEETEEINKKGFPRPVLPYKGKNTPLPWVGGEYPEYGQWARINGDRAYLAELEKLCVVCGEKLPPPNRTYNPNPDDYVFMLVNGEEYSTTAGIMLLGELPSPTWVHPKCGRIASLFCPHLKREEYPAITQNGRRLTHEQLSDLAQQKV